MSKIKPNEIIGGLSMSGMIATTVASVGTGSAGAWTLVIVGLFGITSGVFLSFWGLWTFNPWVESLLKNKQK